MNPELRRYVWLELTPHRLIGMPAVLLTLLYLGYLVTGEVGHELAVWSAWAFAALALVWGTRLAADSVQSEINAHTWDSQRMSALEPWPMTWGKLLGSTVFVWYGCAVAAAVHVVAVVAGGASPLAALEKLWLLGACAVLAHATGMLASLLSVRKLAVRPPGRGAGFYSLGLLAAAPFLVFGLGGEVGPVERAPVDWYGRAVEPARFVLACATAFAAWSVTGVHRLMRVELQWRNGPWVWLGFVAFCMALAAGLVPSAGGTLADLPGDDWPRGPARFLVAATVGLVLVYVVALLEPKDPVALRRLARAVRAGEWRRVGELVPRWALALSVTAIAALAALATYPSAASGDVRIPELDAFVLSALAFALRDTGIVTALNLSVNPRRADAAAVLYLLVLYLLVPAILAVMGLDGVRLAFVPEPHASVPLALAPPLVEAGLVWWLVRWRWRRLARAMSGRRERPE